MEHRFNRHSERLLERHGTRVWRLGIDAGFSCPRREGGRGRGGCDFCSPDAGLATYQRSGDQKVEGMEAQLLRAINFSRRRYGASAFMVYFQAYTCTNLPADELKPIYDAALGIVERAAPGALRGMVVSTRPDCLDVEKAALIGSYARSGFELWLELGLQSANDATLARVRRGHTAADFAKAMRIAGDAGLRRAAHLMLGLPGEARADMLATVDFAAGCGMEGVKFHDLRLVKGSALERRYPAGEFAPLHPKRLAPLLADCIERMPPSVEVMRLGADFPKGAALDIFPPFEKAALYRAVERELESRGTRQGDALS